MQLEVQYEHPKTEYLVRYFLHLSASWLIQTWFGSIKRQIHVFCPTAEARKTPIAKFALMLRPLVTSQVVWRELSRRHLSIRFGHQDMLGRDSITTYHHNHQVKSAKSTTNRRGMKLQIRNTTVPITSLVFRNCKTILHIQATATSTIL